MNPRRISLLLALACGWLPLSLPSEAALPGPLPWGTDGNVLAVARSGETLYIGGNFSQVGPVTGGGAPLDARSSVLPATFPRVAGSVHAVCPDGQGGWYIGGAFTAVDGQPRANVAHILAGGRVSPWHPVLNGGVGAIVLADGVVIVGGYFTTVNGTVRVAVAAIDRFGRPTSWNADVLGANNIVSAIVRQGRTLYLGGDFLTVHGRPQMNFAAVDLSTAVSVGVMPSVNGLVRDLAVANDRILLGGAFTQVGDSSRAGLAAVDVAGKVSKWNPGLSGPIEQPTSFSAWALLVDGGTVYVGGRFRRIGPFPCNGLAAVDAQTGQVLDWDPDLTLSAGDALVECLTLVHPNLYVGGSFDSVGPDARNCLAAVDVRTARATQWNPRPNGTVSALSANRDVIYAGGTFWSFGDWLRRRSLAAIDLRTGRATSWDPNPSDFSLVYAIVPMGDQVYVGGGFLQISEVPRVGIAVIDSATGLATSWDAMCDGYLTSMVRVGQRLYVGGGFGTIGGLPRRNLAAIDLNDGSVTAWNPGANSEVSGLAAHGDRIYAGGFFTRLGGQLHRFCGAVDTAGQVSSWDPQSDGYVVSLAATDSSVYAAGIFENIGGQPRHFLAGLSSASAQATVWDPQPAGTQTGSPTRIWSLATGDSALYVGGDFTTINGEPAAGAAAFDLSGGSLPWRPNVDGVVWSLLAEPEWVYLGGAFTSVEGVPLSSIAVLRAIGGNQEPTSPPNLIELSQNAPNPTSNVTTIRFRLAAPGSVTLTVYDLQGRVKARLLDNVAFPAGTHQVGAETAPWPAGCYLYRIEAEGEAATRKMLVLR